MKTILFLLVLIPLAYNGFGQDPLQGEVSPVDKIESTPTRVDTVWVEKVKVDTVWVEKAEVESKPEQAQAPQPTTQKSDKKSNKVYYGGYANFSFGKYTVIGIEPLIAYKLLPKLSIGGKITYEYVRDNRYDIVNEVSNYGVGVFSRLRIGRRLYAHIEYAEMNYKLYDNLGISERTWIPFLFLGGGITLPISKRTSVNAEVLWDLIQDEDSPYKTVEPFISVGIGVGF